MKSFKIYNPDLKIKKPDFKKINAKIKNLLQKQATIVIILAIIFGFGAGLASSAYFYTLANKNQNAAQETTMLSEQNSGAEETIPKVVQDASPAVVSIVISKYVPILETSYYNPFGDNSPFDIRIPVIQQKGEKLQEVGGGSGFIVSSDGLIVTNKHVVSDAEAQYTVFTNDGKKYDAQVLARDPIQDMAIVKIQAANLPTLKLGNSDKLEIGQTVIAIGNALGEFRNTVSAGIVSGLSRTITASGGGQSEELNQLIQTDAAINPGNSGGPLLDTFGKVVGINTATVENAQSIGFAIPVNEIAKAINDVETKGKITYALLGVRYVLINDAVAQADKLSVNYGALISKGSSADEPAITPGSAAEKAGLKEGDIILEMDGVQINEQNPLSSLIFKHNPGDNVVLKVLRDNQQITVNATLGELK